MGRLKSWNGWLGVSVIGQKVWEEVWEHSGINTDIHIVARRPNRRDSPKRHWHGPSAALGQRRMIGGRIWCRCSARGRCLLLVLDTTFTFGTIFRQSILLCYRLSLCATACRIPSIHLTAHLIKRSKFRLDDVLADPEQPDALGLIVDSVCVPQSTFTLRSVSLATKCVQPLDGSSRVVLGYHTERTHFRLGLLISRLWLTYVGVCCCLNPPSNIILTVF